MKIGILYICTSKYKIFWKDFYLSCEKYFIPEAEKHYFVFTDADEVEFEKDNILIHRIYQKNLGWPDNTLMRYDMFYNIKDKFADVDYIFFFNADLICIETITGNDFLPQQDKNLIAVLHPGYYNKKKSSFHYETNERSKAYVDRSSGKYYFAGGLNGGKTKEFIEAIGLLRGYINNDKDMNITARWHDESHWNKYLMKRTDVKIINPGYLYPEAGHIPFIKKIMIRDKRKYFSYRDVGKDNNTNRKRIRNIKNIIEKIGFIQRSFVWQIIKKWINRLVMLRTIYRNDKFNAIKNFIKNDADFLRIKREIDTYKNGHAYDFCGVKIPLSVITPDTYLNVLKPSIESIKYDEESIETFYKKQKAVYYTLSYLKDNYIVREPDFIGAHIISHGFTYFYNEITIKKGDTVIDLGAAPGDFSALCIKYGASRVYAFEPEEGSSSNLEGVRKLNGDKIEIIRKYSGDKTNSGTNTITLDEFVTQNKIQKIDFIKADIEGAEANSLIGAKNILKNHRPKLSFCTYHSIDDEKNIERAILEANPDYKIYKRKGVLYAY